MSDAKAAPVKDTTVKPGDTSTHNPTSTWSDIASRMWDSLRTDITSTKPAGTGKDTSSGDNPGSGAGGGATPDVLTKPPATGIMSGDGRDPGKKSSEDQKGFIHFGDITTGDGRTKLPPSDDRGVVSTGGKFKTDNDKSRPPLGDQGGLEHPGGKLPGPGQTLPGRRGGDDRTMPTGHKREVPGKVETPKPGVPDLGMMKPDADQGKGKSTDVMRPRPNPLHTDKQPVSKYGPHPDSAPSEAPSSEDQEAASDIVHDGDVSSMMGLDSVSQQAADAIISGDFAELQGILKGLEDKGPEGAQQLDAMAKQLGNLLGTEVHPHISDDNKFSLNVETEFSDNRGGCFPTGTSITNLNIPSEGEMTASSSRYWNAAYPRTSSADASVEATRLQALGTRSVLELPTFLNDMNDTDFTPSDPDKLR